MNSTKQKQQSEIIRGMKLLRPVVKSLAVISVIACCFFTLAAQKAAAPKPPKQNNTAAIKREIREFYDSFAEDLRRHQREAIADRHDPRGYFKVGNGKKTFFTFEEIKNRYLNQQIKI